MTLSPAKKTLKRPFLIFRAVYKRNMVTKLECLCLIMFLLRKRQNKTGVKQIIVREKKMENLEHIAHSRQLSNE